MTGSTNRTEQPHNAAAPELAQKLAFLEAPALLPLEPAEEYVARLNELTAQLQPTDGIDKKLVRDLAHYEWTSVRYRNMLAHLVVVSEQQALAGVLQRLLGGLDEMPAGEVWGMYGNRHEVLARQYVMKKPDAVNKVDGLLAEAGLTWGSIEAEAMANRMYEVERIDRMMRTADEHWHRVQRELERRRNERAKAAQRARRVERQGDLGAQDAAVRKLAA
jgi:hypothetical protein